MPIEWKTNWSTSVGLSLAAVLLTRQRKLKSPSSTDINAPFSPFVLLDLFRQLLVVVYSNLVEKCVLVGIPLAVVVCCCGVVVVGVAGLVVAVVVYLPL